MILETLDWGIILGFMAVTLAIGVYTGRNAGKSSDDFFLSGRAMPWWLLGFSMVATTFSTDTPNLVANITRLNGVAGNWSWWAFLLTGMLTSFLFAHLWRRSGVSTDIEFYEMRYEGKPASFLRVFRAIYVGVIFNVMIMASVTLSAIKFGAVLFGLNPLDTVLIASVVTVIFSAIGGLRGILFSDFILFIVAMCGAIVAAYVAIGHPDIGSLSNLMQHPNVSGKLNFFPDMTDPASFVPLLLIPLAVQWWSVWYPGSEPGGGGYIAQRMLAAKDEKNAVGAIVFFNAVHFALRPWPWIVVALASLVVFPDLDSLRHTFPHIDESVIGHDMAYPAMLTFLPTGWLGFVAASLVAAYMSTISTSLNLGSAYLVNDVYQRFIKPEASQKELVLIGRITTVAIMILAGIFALLLSNALQVFKLLLSIGAGTGLLFILRWYWHRINAWSEISAMVISFVVSMIFEFSSLTTLPDWLKLTLAVTITTFGWVIVTLLTPPTSHKKLDKFYLKIRPSGPGWRTTRSRVIAAGHDLPQDDKLSTLFICMFIGCIVIYGMLFTIGSLIKGSMVEGTILCAITLITSYIGYRCWKHLNFQNGVRSGGNA
ncbi:sodium:solute symporter family protein [Paremcibacter congregatus]|uniref:sodium:solute symporter family protein n=1 Tax=Paremcibacter congregatus TaxID=2043170 RepID=UPI003A959E5A